MVRVHFNWYGFEFQNAVQGLWDGYSAANLGLEDQRNHAYNSIDDYDTRRDQGQLEPFEADEISENGFVRQSYREFLVYRAHNLENQAHDLRLAYSLMLYHQWERSARSWVKHDHGSFEGLKSRVKARGIFVDPALDDLHVLVNLLKHNNAKHGQKLSIARPDLFGDSDVSDMTHRDWFSGVEVSHHALEVFFMVVKNSGPDSSSEIWEQGEAPF